MKKKPKVICIRVDSIKLIFRLMDKMASYNPGLTQRHKDWRARLFILSVSILED